MDASGGSEIDTCPQFNDTSAHTGVAEDAAPGSADVQYCWRDIPMIVRRLAQISWNTMARDFIQIALYLRSVSIKMISIMCWKITSII